jgi:oligopeptide transport system substrate-binding protein
MTKLKWRALLSVFAIFAILAITAACGDDDSTTATTPAGGGTTAAAAPSGTITIGGTQFETWDPHFSDFQQDISHFFMVWRGLYEFDLNSKPVPSMADGAPVVSDGGKTYTVKLKANLKWSDGSPLTAADFVAGLQRTCNPDNAGHYEYVMTDVVGCVAYYSSNGDPKATPPKPASSDAQKEALRTAMGVRAVDASTVEYKLIDPQPTFPILLAMWQTFPMNSAKIKVTDTKWPGPLENVYNGPFMPSAYTEKDHMDLVPNPNWAGAQKAQVAKITIKYIDDLAVMDNAYRNGELDAANVDTSQLDAVQKDATLSKELVEYPSTRTTALQFNLLDPQLSNKNLRLALSQAVDRVSLNKVALKGANSPSTSWMPPPRSGVAAGAYDSLIGFDLTKAKANLQASGIAPGAVNITLTLTDTPGNHAMGEFLQNAWKTNLGVDSKLSFVDAKTRSAAFNSKNFSILPGGWQEDYPDPENWMLGQMETGGSINKTSVSVPALDAVLAKAKLDTNDEERRGLYQQAEKLLLEGANGFAPLYQNGQHRLVKPYISGMKEWKRPSDSFVPGDWNPEYWKTSKK